jgi:hypothetical protein
MECTGERPVSSGASTDRSIIANPLDNHCDCSTFIAVMRRFVIAMSAAVKHQRHQTAADEQ